MIEDTRTLQFYKRIQKNDRFCIIFWMSPNTKKVLSFSLVNLSSLVGGRSKEQGLLDPQRVLSELSEWFADSLYEKKLS